MLLPPFFLPMGRPLGERERGREREGEEEGEGVGKREVSIIASSQMYREGVGEIPVSSIEEAIACNSLASKIPEEECQ